MLEGLSFFVLVQKFCGSVPGGLRLSEFRVGGLGWPGSGLKVKGHVSHVGSFLN